MRSPVPDYLAEVLDACAVSTTGSVADYIPELAAADPDRSAVSLCTVDGVDYRAGDTGVEFTIQSIAKPFVYAMAIADNGLDAVSAKVGVEPSGEAFDELSLEQGSGRPRNPMINAGALTVHALVADPSADTDTRVRRIVDGLSALAGRDLVVDESVFASEFATAYRNRSLAHMLRSHDVVTADPDDVVRGYTRQCSVRVTTSDLAVMAATLAGGGVQPVTGERVLSAACVRRVLSVMAGCGMYDGAGDWLTTVGIPAKSGVSGGIIGALPGQVGIAAFSPRLDDHGNSVRGVEICTRLSADMGLHLMEAAQPARAVLREVHASGEPVLSRYELQGSLQFAGAERVLRALSDHAAGQDHVAMDLSRVHEINDVARRMLLEAVRRLSLDGHTVWLVDLLPDPGAGDGVEPRVVTSVSELPRP